VTASTAGKKERDAQRGNSNARSCAVCLGGDWRVLDNDPAISRFFLIGLPAFYKPRREILWPSRDPTINDRRRKESSSLDFILVRCRIAANFCSINPEKFLSGPRRGRKLENLFKWNIDSQFFL